MSAMDAACNLVYVDRAAHKERLVRRGESVLTEEERLVDGVAATREGVRTLESNIQTLLGSFSKGACVRAGEPLIRVK